MELNIVNTEYICIDYPGIVKNVDKMLKTLGGVTNIENIINDPIKRLELKFRPDDVFCKPVYGDREFTNCLVLRVRRKKIKNKTDGNSSIENQQLNQSSTSLLKQNFSVEDNRLIEKDKQISQYINTEGINSIHCDNDKYFSLSRSSNGEEKHSLDRNISIASNFEMEKMSGIEINFEREADIRKKCEDRNSLSCQADENLTSLCNIDAVNNANVKEVIKVDILSNKDVVLIKDGVYPNKDDVHSNKDYVHINKDDVHINKDDVLPNKEDVYSNNDNLLTNKNDRFPNNVEILPNKDDILLEEDNGIVVNILGFSQISYKFSTLCDFQYLPMQRIQLNGTTKKSNVKDVSISGSLADPMNEENISLNHLTSDLLKGENIIKNRKDITMANCSDIVRYKSLVEDIYLDGIKSMEWFDRKDVPLFLLPNLFCRLDKTLFYSLRELGPAQTSQLTSISAEGGLKNVTASSNIDLVKRSQTFIGRARKKRYNYTKFFKFTDANVPMEPFQEACKRLNSVRIMMESKLKFIKELFEKHPIWTQAALRAELPKSLGLWKNNLKILLPVVAFYHMDGPWRATWNLLGYDPRKNPTSKIYQILDFRFNRGLFGYFDTRSKRSIFDHNLPKSNARYITFPHTAHALIVHKKKHNFDNNNLKKNNSKKMALDNNNTNNNNNTDKKRNDNFDKIDKINNMHIDDNVNENNKINDKCDKIDSFISMDIDNSVNYNNNTKNNGNDNQDMNNSTGFHISLNDNDEGFKDGGEIIGNKLVNNNSSILKDLIDNDKINNSEINIYNNDDNSIPINNINTNSVNNNFIFTEVNFKNVYNNKTNNTSNFLNTQSEDLVLFNAHNTNTDNNNINDDTNKNFSVVNINNNNKKNFSNDVSNVIENHMETQDDNNVINDFNNSYNDKNSTVIVNNNNEGNKFSRWTSFLAESKLEKRKLLSEVMENEYIFRPGLFPAYRQVHYLFYHLMEDQIQTLIHANDGEETECYEKDGWCLPDTVEKIRVIMNSYLPDMNDSLKRRSKVNLKDS